MVPNRAYLGDTPGTNPDNWWYVWFRSEFRTEVVCLEGKEAGKIYASIWWGHEFDFTTGTVKRWIYNNSVSGPTTSSKGVDVFYGPVAQ
jgi:hypothetical protein